MDEGLRSDPGVLGFIVRKLDGWSAIFDVHAEHEVVLLQMCNIYYDIVKALLYLYYY